MKAERVLFEHAKSVSAILNVVVASAMSIALSGCATPKPETKPENILDLTGTWNQVNAEEKDNVFKASINNESITISSVAGDTETIWWEGSYEIPKTSEDKYSWISEVKTEESNDESEAWDDVKTLSFDYADGILSFVIPVDEKTVIEFEREKEQAKLDYSKAEVIEIKDSDGKVTGKYSVLTVNKAVVSDDVIEDWYNSYVADGDYEYAVIVFADEEGKGIYADSKNVYLNTDLSENKNNGYSKPDSKPTYTVKDGKIDVTEDKAEADTAEKTEKAEDKEANDDKKKEENSSNTASSDSKKNTSAASNTSKPSGGNTTTTKPSNNTGTSSGGNQTTNTKPADPNAGKTKVWVVDTPAWDETIVVTPAWTEEKVVVDTPAWDETVVITPSYDVTTCNNCGAQFTGPSQVSDCGMHQADECGGWGYHTDTIPAVTQIVHHDAVTHVEYIQHEAVTQVIHHDEVGHWEWR